MIEDTIDDKPFSIKKSEQKEKPKQVNLLEPDDDNLFEADENINSREIADKCDNLAELKEALQKFSGLSICKTATNMVFVHRSDTYKRKRVPYKQIAELITADTDTKIYYVSLSGFDTHVNQKGQQERLLKQYADGIAALVNDLKQNHLFDDTLIMTFSEFGRRVKQNGSNGTDHGTANNVFVIGKDLKKNGIYNALPNLNDLDSNGDLRFSIDFREVYATLLDKWLGIDNDKILNKRFSNLNFI